MAVWLIQALRLLAASAAGGAGFAVGTEALAPTLFGPRLPARAGGGIDPITMEPLPIHPHRRRRRRRALTASDRADIAFIAGLLGPAAGSKFAAIIGAK